MTIGKLRQRAAALVERLAEETPIEGAWFFGSMATAPDDAPLPPTSDLDVMVVLPNDAPTPSRSKFACGDALIELSFISKTRLAADAPVDYHLANSLRHDSILRDARSGDLWLRNLQQRIAAHFADEQCVRRRRDSAIRKVEGLLATIDENGVGGNVPWHEQVAAWLFGTGVTTHVLLVAALQNPTVRFRYLAVRQVLHEYKFEDVYDELLDLLGCRALSRNRVHNHLDRLASVFDEAASVASTPLPFSCDITPASRRLVIDACDRLIQQEDHREAVFWIAVTYTRCVAILDKDGSRDQRLRAESRLNDLLTDLGISDQTRLRQRAAAAIDYLPHLTKVADEIIKANRRLSQRHGAT